MRVYMDTSVLELPARESRMPILHRPWLVYSGPHI